MLFENTWNKANKIIEYKKGDLLEMRRAGYCHWAVCIGDGWVIHVRNKNNGIKGGIVCRERLDNLSASLNIVIGSWLVNNDMDACCQPHPPDGIINRAESKIGSWEYNLGKNNCEHFAKWCRYGSKACHQVVYAENNNEYMAAGLGTVTLGPAKITLPNAIVGVRDDEDAKQITYEIRFGSASIGRVNATVGLGITTGIRSENGSVGFQILGTGMSIGRETKISLFGTSIGLRLR